MHATTTFYHQDDNTFSVFTTFRGDDGAEALRENVSDGTTRLSATRPLTPAELVTVQTERSENVDLERQEKPQHYEFTA